MMEAGQTKQVYCPGCGTPQMATDIISKMSFECAKCKTRWTVTFDTGEDALIRAFINAEDHI